MTPAFLPSMVISAPFVSTIYTHTRTEEWGRTATLHCLIHSYGQDEELTFPLVSCMLTGGVKASHPTRGSALYTREVVGRCSYDDRFRVSVIRGHISALFTDWAYGIFCQHSCPRSKLDCLPCAFYHVYN